MKNYFQSHTVSRIILALAVLLLVLLVFQAGLVVGYHRGVFSSNWNSAYGRGMSDPHFLFAPLMHDGDVVNSHGAFGKIVSLTFPSLMIKGQNSAEELVNISSSTSIRFMHGMASTSDLVPGNQVIIIGEPSSNGSIDAVFIRILPNASTSVRQ